MILEDCNVTCSVDPYSHNQYVSFGGCDIVCLCDQIVMLTAALIPVCVVKMVLAVMLMTF